MHLRPILALSCIVASAAFAAEPPSVPSESIAKKNDLLFSDDFQEAQLGKVWHQAVPTFVIENGVLKGTQTRDQNIPAADGKPEVKAHPAVESLVIPTKDSVIEVKIRFEGATLIDVEFDDRAFTGSHYGHLCRAQVRLDKVVISDERDGSQSNTMQELRKDPVANKSEIGKLYASHSATFPVKLEANTWYTLVVETVGEAMRVSIDGKPVAYFKSPGIGHPTKSQIELGVQGKSGLYDDIKVWNAEPAK
jgi:hypothetical protein